MEVKNVDEEKKRAQQKRKRKNIQKPYCPIDCEQDLRRKYL